MREVRGRRQSDTVQSVLITLWMRSRMGFTLSQCTITSRQGPEGRERKKEITQQKWCHYNLSKCLVNRI